MKPSRSSSSDVPSTKPSSAHRGAGGRHIRLLSVTARQLKGRACDERLSIGSASSRNSPPLAQASRVVVQRGKPGPAIPSHGSVVVVRNVPPIEPSAGFSAGSEPALVAQPRGRSTPTRPNRRCGIPTGTCRGIGRARRAPGCCARGARPKVGRRGARPCPSTRSRTSQSPVSDGARS
jgi:hypothetical protein